MESQTNATSSHGTQQQHPVYNTENGGHYGASATVAAQGYGPAPELYTGAWANVNQGLHGTYREILATYWQQIIRHLETDNHDYKLHHLPLARIKKVMKADPDVKMISAEAPILFAKGCDIFITELTMRAWIHAEENKRRTLQRSDIASALAKSDMFDFLIDIVPREEATSQTKRTNPPGGSAGTIQGSTGSNASGAQIPSQQAGASQQPPQPQHNMGPPDYSGLGNHSMNPDSDYRTQPGMYAGAVQSGAPGGYGQSGQPIYGEMDGIYGYNPISQQQQMYHVAQRGQDPSVGQDPGHSYPRHDGGEGDVDADGERDYEVG